MYINLITEESIKENMENKLKCHVHRGFIIDGFIFQGIPFFLRLEPFLGTIYVDAILSNREFDRYRFHFHTNEFYQNLKIDNNFEIDGSGSSYRGLIDRFKNLGLLIPPYDEEIYIPTNFHKKQWYEKSEKHFAVAWSLHNANENKTDEKLLKILFDLNSKSQIQILDNHTYENLLSHSKKKEKDEKSLNIDLNYINNFIFKVTLLVKEKYFFAGENDTRKYEYEISDIESFIKQDF